MEKRDALAQEIVADEKVLSQETKQAQFQAYQSYQQAIAKLDELETQVILAMARFEMREAGGVVEGIDESTKDIQVLLKELEISIQMTPVAAAEINEEDLLSQIRESYADTSEKNGDRDRPLEGKDAYSEDTGKRFIDSLAPASWSSWLSNKAVQMTLLVIGIVALMILGYATKDNIIGRIVLLTASVAGLLMIVLLGPPIFDESSKPSTFAENVDDTLQQRDVNSVPPPSTWSSGTQRNEPPPIPQPMPAKKCDTNVGNLITCARPSSNSWIKVFQLNVDGTWSDIIPLGRGPTDSTGRVKIDGLPVDDVLYGCSGHPYRIQLWAEGALIRSVGDTSRGEPEFRIRPGVDNFTPWGCPAP